MPGWDQVEGRVAGVELMMPPTRLAASDLDQLFRGRLFVARMGERDVLKWWAIDGILGPDRAFVGLHVLPMFSGTARTRIAPSR